MMKNFAMFAFLTCASLVAVGAFADESQSAAQGGQLSQDQSLPVQASAQGPQLDAGDEALLADSVKADDIDGAISKALVAGLAGAPVDSQGDLLSLYANDVIDTNDHLLLANPIKFFRPSGCITSTRTGRGQWVHVLNNCSGPSGRSTFSGTVHATWTFDNGVLNVEYEATNFAITGDLATARLLVDQKVSYSLDNGKIVRHRVSDLSGTIAAKGDTSNWLPFTRHNDCTLVWNHNDKSVRRDGRATSTIGNDSFERTLTGYMASGSLDACPTAGQLLISSADGSRQLTLDLLGGGQARITGSRGNSVIRKISCDL